MTEHEHAEVSRKLALAIGWGLVYTYPENSGKSGTQVRLGNDWVDFDYRDPSVIWAVAERFNCFPSMWDGVGPKAWIAWCEPVDDLCYADTAALAVARAVIASQEAK